MQDHLHMSLFTKICQKLYHQYRPSRQQFILNTKQLMKDNSDLMILCSIFAITMQNVAIISISEDARRVIARVDYDNETNCCVGFVATAH